MYVHSGDARSSGYDTRVYGDGHADTIITVSLEGLRLYEDWVCKNGVDGRTSPGRGALVHDVHMDPGEAMALHELLVRLKGPHPLARAPGCAIPPLA